GSLCLCVRAFCSLLTHQLSRWYINTHTPQEPLSSVTWATSLSPPLPPKRLLSRKQAQRLALCSTFNHSLCIMHTVHSKKPVLNALSSRYTHNTNKVLHPLRELRYGSAQRPARGSLCVTKDA
ncbi:hypothetical protein AMECASPLE_008541, partial [Ameca splendens]